MREDKKSLVSLEVVINNVDFIDELQKCGFGFREITTILNVMSDMGYTDGVKNVELSKTQREEIDKEWERLVELSNIIYGETKTK